MRAVVQRVTRAEVRVAGSDGGTEPNQLAGRIGVGLLAYVGSAEGDEPADIEYVADKLVGLRVFRDSAGKMNLSASEVGGGILVVPAFTTLADARQGRRPGFVAAARPESAEPAFQALIEALKARGVPVAAGRFRETMAVESVNDGPICILLDSRKLF